MKKALIAILVAVSLGIGAARAQDAKSALDAAAAALGTANLKTIQFSGRGSDFMFGQAYTGDNPWPRFSVPSYTVTIDYTIPAIRDDRRRQQSENPPRGGGFQPLVGELRQIWVMSGNYAWDVAGQNAVPAAAERDIRSAVDGRLAQIWMTPQGFVQAAIANHATAKTETVRGARKTAISFTAPNKTAFEGLLNEQNLPEMITTRFDNPVLGDIAFEAVFRDYKDFGGVKFPTHILQRNGGYPILDVTITDVKPNVSASFDVPANIKQAQQAQPAAQTIMPEKIAEGVWGFPGGARSVAIEFRDHVVVVEGPENEERSIAVIEATKKVIPNKPIRYLINTHSHFDHTGGIRTYAAEGATIITWSGNIPYYEQLAENPRTIVPDRLARAGRKPKFEGVVGSRTLTDGSREAVIYHYPNGHNAGLLMIYLPKEKTLIEADSYTPPLANEPPGGLAFLLQFYDSVQRLGLDIEQVVPIHGRLVTFDEIRRAVETYGKDQLWAK